jgi:hypothetical protein
VSTWLYLTCDSHTPPILSDDVGQHLYDLPAIATAIKHREEVVQLRTPKFMGGRGKPGEVEVFIHRKMREAGEFERPWAFQFPSNAANFLVSHQGCEIGIQDEYDRRYNPLTGEVI